MDILPAWIQRALFVGFLLFVSYLCVMWYRVSRAKARAAWTLAGHWINTSFELAWKHRERYGEFPAARAVLSGQENDFPALIAALVAKDENCFLELKNPLQWHCADRDPESSSMEWLRGWIPLEEGRQRFVMDTWGQPLVYRCKKLFLGTQASYRVWIYSTGQNGVDESTEDGLGGDDFGRCEVIKG